MYFALAAARFAPVLLNGIVGADTAARYRALFEGTNVDLEGLVVSERPTFVWHAVHDFERWVTSHEEAEPGCDPEWRPDLPEPSRLAPVLFVASMAPSLQRVVLDQSAAELAGADSMAVFLHEDHDAVVEVTSYADILFLNAAELTLLTEEDDWRVAARRMVDGDGPRAVVVKHGPLGAACVTPHATLEQAAAPVREVVDPTGAGDALAGGFLGCCAALERHDEAVFAEALAMGVRCAADAISTFGPEGLRAAGW